MNSLRLSLKLVSLLAAVTFTAAALSLWGLARSSTMAQTERVEAMALDEASRIADAPRPPDTVQRHHRPHRGLRGGSFDPLHQSIEEVFPGRIAPLAREAFREAQRTHRPAVRSATLSHHSDSHRRHRAAPPPDGPSLVAFAIAPSEYSQNTLYTWGFARLPPRDGARPWRLVVLFVSLASIALVIVSLRTLTRLDQATVTLARGITSLSQDLTHTIDRPSVRELAEVADGINTMASAVLSAQRERDSLSHALEARERLAALGRVVTGVAHEVRNPLAAIKLKVDLAAMALGSTEPTITNDLSTVSDEVSRLDRLVNDLLVISGRRQGAHSTLDLAEVLHSRVALLAPMLTAREITVAIMGEATVTADRDGLVRALDNLLRNAVEASPHGETILVELETHEATDKNPKNKTVTVRVCDHGEGVSSERTPEIFEPFFTTKPEGTGLGLALSRAVALAHGGTLRYLREGNRTVFELSLPVTKKSPSQ